MARRWSSSRWSSRSSVSSCSGSSSSASLYNDYVTLTDAARVGARKAADSRHDADPVAAAEAAARSSAKGLDPAKLDVAVSRDRWDHGESVTVDGHVSVRDRPSGVRRGVGEPDFRDHGACGMNRVGSERGQAAVLTVIFIAALLGAVAMVLDVGSWFRAQRATQSAADAAALAGAQALPEEPGTANALATQYLDTNGGGAGDDHVLEQERRQRHCHRRGQPRQAPGYLREALRDRLRRRARERRVRARAAWTRRAMSRPSRSTSRTRC